MRPQLKHLIVWVSACRATAEFFSEYVGMKTTDRRIPVVDFDRAD